MTQDKRSVATNGPLTPKGRGGRLSQTRRNRNRRKKKARARERMLAGIAASTT